MKPEDRVILVIVIATLAAMLLVALSKLDLDGTGVFR